MLFKNIIISIAIFITTSSALSIQNQLIRRQDGGAASADTETSDTDASAVDSTATQAPTIDINGVPIPPEANVPADAQRVEVVTIPDDSAPKRDSHISLTNGVLNGAKLAFAGVTGIDNQNKD